MSLLIIGFGLGWAAASLTCWWFVGKAQTKEDG